jgi:cbb3-type cytochrome oxidase subunit 3
MDSVLIGRICYTVFCFVVFIAIVYQAFRRQSLQRYDEVIRQFESDVDNPSTSISSQVFDGDEQK